MGENGEKRTSRGGIPGFAKYVSDSRMSFLLRHVRITNVLGGRRQFQVRQFLAAHGTVPDHSLSASDHSAKTVIHFIHRSESVSIG